MFSKIFPPIHTEGYKFLVIAGFITLVLLFISGFLGTIGLLLTVWVYYFFRDPERVIIEDDNYLVSPADGEVIKVEEVDGPKEVGLENKKFKKISILPPRLALASLWTLVELHHLLSQQASLTHRLALERLFRRHPGFASQLEVLRGVGATAVRLCCSTTCATDVSRNSQLNVHRVR